MKRAELNARKDLIRAMIKSQQAKIIAALTTKQAIPRKIVDGSHSQIIEYKQYCENALKIYHVTNDPADRMTIPQLTEVKTRLDQICVKLGLQVNG